VDETEFLKQVGKTVHGQSISDDQFKQIILEMTDRLDLGSDDVVLDLCCGNGLITNEFARVVRSIVGVDYSLSLINIARKYHSPRNTYYINTSIFDLTREDIEDFIPFSKVYMYEALQHFQRKDLFRILRFILPICTKNVVIFFGSVPDKARLWKFYDSPMRRLNYLKRKLQRQEAIGTWWKRGFIQDVCNRMGLHCEFFQQHEMLHTSHYRFDFRVTRYI
jgi:2-polyprenyl-3-methyl-5-hydroxy-6-metoxy-1,4-benzoquinol methylase